MSNEIELKPCPFCGRDGVKSFCCGPAIPNCPRCSDLFGCSHCDVWLDTADEWNARTVTARPDEPKGDRPDGQVITDTLEGRALGMAIRPIVSKGELADLLVEFATKELQAERTRREEAIREILELVEKERKGCDWRDFDGEDTPWGGFEWACERIYEAIADRFTKDTQTSTDTSEVDEALKIEITELKEIVTAPIDMIIFCPSCRRQHVDAPNSVRCQDCGHTEINHAKVAEGLTCSFPGCKCTCFVAWSNPPHKSHRCLYCNVVFRIADVPTNGVKNIQTKGENDTWAIHVQSSGD